MKIRFPNQTRHPQLHAGVEVDDPLIDQVVNGKGAEPDMPDYIRWTAGRMAVGERRVCYGLAGSGGWPVCQYEIERIE